MNRIVEKFNNLVIDNKKALIPFIMAGDPYLDATEKLVYTLEKAGADIIEIGIPYSDPLADGPIIQASSARALKNGIKISNIIEKVKKIREKTEIPLVFLVYYNSIFKFGMDKFMLQCNLAGIDGLVIPDLPLEEREEISLIADKYNLCIIPLVTPASKERIGAITKNGKGFVYCVSINGVTGTTQDIGTNIKEYMEYVSKFTDMPKGLGFGISSADMAEKFAPFCQAIIIGSAIIKLIAEATTEEQLLKNVYDFAFDVKCRIG